MKKIVIVLSVLACAVFAQASEYAYLVFTNTSGVNTVLSVSSMTMTVNGSELTITNAEGTQVFTLTDLASMQFSKDGSITALENVLDGDKPVEVYAVNGTSVGSFSSMLQAVKDLNAGIYIVKQGDKTQKVVVR